MSQTLGLTAAGDLAALPAEQPMAMPVQALDAAPPHGRRPVTSPRGIAFRRLFVIGGAVVMTVAGGEQMYLVLNGNGPSILGILVLVLFLALFAWVALAFMSALGGFIAGSIRRRSRPRHHAGRPAARPRQPHRAADADL